MSSRALRDPLQAARGPLAGALAETLVVAELAKDAWHRGQRPRLYFWRTSTGVEVDVLLEAGGVLAPIETKARGTAVAAMAGGIRRLRADLGDAVAPGYVAYTLDRCLPLGDGTLALPIADL